VYFFGGGDLAVGNAGIVRVDPVTGRASTAGRLPLGVSDVGAAAIGGTAYVVDGYTGTRAVNTIVAWQPGRAARVVARTPQPLRYAAVAAIGGKLVIAGGSTPSAASRDILELDPAGGGVRRIGQLPRTLTHAAAVPLGRYVYVIGGRGATPGTPADRIFAVDPATGHVTAAGRLPRPLSDVSAAAIGNAILVAGGRDTSGARAEILQLEPRP
jgi:N-acetylneuraminic acid mutarotase